MTDTGHRQQPAVRVTPQTDKLVVEVVEVPTAQADADAKRAAGDLAELVKAVTPAGEIAEDAAPPTVGLLLKTILPGQ